MNSKLFPARKHLSTYTQHNSSNRNSNKIETTDRQIDSYSCCVYISIFELYLVFPLLYTHSQKSKQKPKCRSKATAYIYGTHSNKQFNTLVICDVNHLRLNCLVLPANVNWNVKVWNIYKKTVETKKD